MKAYIALFVALCAMAIAPAMWRELKPDPPVLKQVEAKLPTPNDGRLHPQYVLRAVDGSRLVVPSSTFVSTEPGDLVKGHWER